MHIETRAQASRRTGAAIWLVLVFCASGLLFGLVTAIAQEEAVTYQGQLNLSGESHTGLVDLQFTIFDQLSSGLAIAQTSLVDVPVEDGLFQVELDFGPGVFNDQPRYLEVRVDGVALSPRQAVRPAPMALFALNGNQGPPGADGAENAWGLQGSAGTNPAVDYIGTSDDQPVVLKADGRRVGWLESIALDTGSTANVLLGSEANTVASGAVGATVGGGGGPVDPEIFDQGPNHVIDSYGTVSGGLNNRSNGFATVGGGWINSADGLGSVVSGGVDNVASGLRSMIGGGILNSVAGSNSVVAGGIMNSATGHRSFIGGGESNSTNAEHTVVAGGVSNSATDSGSFVGGGEDNQAANSNAVVSGGQGNLAAGMYSMVPGGFNNEASGDQSLAAGTRATAGHNGTFVWGDTSTPDRFESTANNQFLIRATGGVGIGTSDPQAPLHVQTPVGDPASLWLRSGGSWGLVLRQTPDSNFQVSNGGSVRMHLTPSGNLGIGTTSPGSFRLAVDGNAAKPGGGSWSTFSDLRLKRDVAPLDGGVLDRMLSLRGYRFEYTREAVREQRGRPGRQIGLIAQEVHEVFPDWVDVDDDGFLFVTERATTALTVEALRELRAEKDREIRALEARVDRLEAALESSHERDNP